MTISLTAAPLKPFPQNEKYPGIIQPTIVTQEQMNSSVALFYDGWKKEYIKKTKSLVGGYYLSTNGGTNVEENAISVSEGHGYGMLSVVLMAGYDTDAQEIFDGFYKVFRAYPSDIDSNLMTWQILGKVGEYELPDLASSATDGDFDIAYALVLADRQWGSKGTINYLAEAQKVIAAFAEHDVHPQSKRVLLGDWVNDSVKWAHGTRSSDWVTGHYALFGEVSGDTAFWSEVNQTIYDIIAAVQNPTTGLLPDFVDGFPAQPAPAGYLEGDNDGGYGSNSCRDPWRFGLAVMHYGDTDIKQALSKLMDWVSKTYSDDLTVVDNGFKLDGTPMRKVDDWGTWGAYSAPFMVGAATDSSYQEMVNSGWVHNSLYKKEVGYYGNSIRLLSLLAVSGNWWKP